MEKKIQKVLEFYGIEGLLNTLLAYTSTNYCDTIFKMENPSELIEVKIRGETIDIEKWIDEIDEETREWRRRLVIEKVEYKYVNLFILDEEEEKEYKVELVYENDTLTYNKIEEKAKVTE